MSELQAALLTIGFGVIVAVYFYGWWQQRHYRRRFGAAFKASHADALYQESGAKPAGQVQQPALAGMADEASGEATIPDVEAAEALPVTNLLDDSCSLLNARSDFIIELRLAEPSPAGALDGLWQRKFDFRKPMQVCGLTLATKKWERAIADSQVLYARFRITARRCGPRENRRRCPARGGGFRRAARASGEDADDEPPRRRHPRDEFIDDARRHRGTLQTKPKARSS